MAAHGGVAARDIGERRRLPVGATAGSGARVIRSERDEAKVRRVLDGAAPLHRDPPKAAVAREGGTAVTRAFMTEALPDADQPRQRAADLIEATPTQVGNGFSAVPRNEAEIVGSAKEKADMSTLTWQGERGRRGA